MHGAQGHQCGEENGESDDENPQVRVLAREHQSSDPSEDHRTELHSDTGVGCGQKEIDHTTRNARTTSNMPRQAARTSKKKTDDLLVGGGGIFPVIW